MNLRDILISELIKAKIPSPRLEADIILKYAMPEYPQISTEQREKALAMLQRRITHEPLDKIIGQREFYKSVFKVNKNVLSPRADTEILVESALELIPQEQDFHILDLGTGSGCILLSLLKERSNCKGTGVDASKEALDIAKENMQNLHLTSQATFLYKSWTDENFVTETFDMIVSNPPYIPTKEIEMLEKDVKDYDPLSALDGGEDGLECYRQIAKVTPLILKPNGYILLEVGYNQAKAVADIFMAHGLTLAKVIPDLSNINRCVILKKSVAK